ncbi:unnamed protein product [Nippostrongylus brasiliensis]|uniref:Inositol polyphosphate 5-phosphatase (inferred by orthology to a C. elegans protein) n=1 Tax=Nippostrongylus brasiliensis TaxID=27835 RepID=A0A0N4YRB3_NIPBR|nr:unnamed protein product [Nippostrongylus brasiliensis]
MNWRVVIITYNVNVQRGNESDIEKLLAPAVAMKPSVLVVGMQYESALLFYGSVEGAVLRIFRTLTSEAYSILEILQEVAHNETVVGGTAVTWHRQIFEWMTTRSDGMVLLSKTYQMTNQVLIFVKRSLLPWISRIEFRYSRNTMGGLTGHKGSIGVKISLLDNVAVVFVVSHFIHDVSSNEKRIAQFHSNKTCCFPEDREVKGVFWFGDLNFRVEKEPEEVVEMMERNTFLALLDSHEQLKRAMRDEEAFIGFSEPSISFRPTYRFVVGSTQYDLKRTPSWCDRVLYMGNVISPVSYAANDKVLVSDHFPVHAVFDLEVPSAQNRSWDVLFELLPTWYTTVPLIGRFQFRNNYWSYDGSYLDWAGVYPVSIIWNLLH